jgi:hypothetical protein
MPALHRYFGTPLTTMILNFLFHTFLGYSLRHAWNGSRRFGPY